MTADRRVSAGRASRWWYRFLFEPESPSPMALVRAGWGIVVAAWALSLLPDIDPFLTDGALRYERTHPDGYWNPLDWVGWRGAPLAACLLLVVTGAATAVGYRTRLTSALALLCLLSLQRTNPTIFNSGDLAMRLIGFSVVLAPSGLVWSVDAARHRRKGDATPRRAPWALRLLQLHLAVGYFLSALGKLQGDTWHEGTAIGWALRIEDLQRFPAPTWLLEQAVLVNLITWATLIFEAAFLFLVWDRRLRPWVLGVGVLFHLGIDLVLDVGWFSIVMWLGYLAFLPPDVADRVVAALDHRRPAWSRRRLVPAAVEPAE